MQSQAFENFGLSLKRKVMIYQTGFICTNWLRRYFDNKELSDAVIRCGGREFPVHQLVLFSHSQYFAKQLSGPWRESYDKVINIEDFDVDVVEAMVHFMYHFDYKTPQDSSALILNAKIYQIADKYVIEPLKEHAANKFRNAAKTFWKSDDFPTAVALVYATTLPTDMGLRNSILVTIFDNFEDIMSRCELYEVLRTNSDFASDLVRLLFEKRRGVYQFKCATCQGLFQFGNASFELRYCPFCRSSCSSWGPLPDA